MPTYIRMKSQTPGNIRSNTLGLGAADLEALLDRLDAQSSGPARKRRAGRRLAFRIANLQCELHHTVGDATPISVAGRNLSRTGCSFLHSSYVHLGTRCTLLLPHKVLGAIRTEGVVARCRHVERIVHEVGVKFANPVRLRDFLRVDTLSDQFSYEQVDPSALSGHVLVVSEYDLDRQLIESLLEGSKVHLSLADSIAAGLKAAGAGVDLVLADSCYEQGGLPELVNGLRDAGHAAAIVVMCPDVGADLREVARALQVDAILSKPIDRDDLLSALAEFLTMAGSSPFSGNGRLTSTLAAQNGMSRLIKDFVVEMHRAAARIDAAAKSKDVASVKRDVVRLVGAAGSMGFSSVAKAAELAHRSLDATGSFDESQPAIRGLCVTLLRTAA